MTNFYVDTSALNKRYIAETGSAWVRTWIRPSAGNVIIVCDLTALESFSIYARLRREKLINQTRQSRLQTVLLSHIQHEYLVISVTASLLTKARELVDKYPLRSLDAIHLASAVQTAAILAEPITFVTSDKQLRAAAHSEGFFIEDPNTHP